MAEEAGGENPGPVVTGTAQLPPRPRPPVKTVAFIYGLKAPGSEEVRYVGKTDNLRKRLRQHVRSARVGSRTWCHKWVRTLLAQGSLPEIFVLEEVTRVNWEGRERHWIQALTPTCSLTNLAPGGRASMAMKGKHHTEEARRKISLGNQGRVCPEQTRVAVGISSRARRGVPRKPRPDLAERNRQRIWTDQSRMLISTSRKGKSISSEHRARLLAGHMKWREQCKDGDAL